MLPFFFFFPFRFQSETVRLIIENTLVCAAVFRHVRWVAGSGVGVSGNRVEANGCVFHFMGFPNCFTPQTFSKPFVNGLN